MPSNMGSPKYQPAILSRKDKSRIANELRRSLKLPCENKLDSGSTHHGSRKPANDIDSEAIDAFDPARIGTASIPDPIKPAANRTSANLPATGRRASAAC